MKVTFLFLGPAGAPGVGIPGATSAFGSAVANGAPGANGIPGLNGATGV